MILVPPHIYLFAQLPFAIYRLETRCSLFLLIHCVSVYTLLPLHLALTCSCVESPSFVSVLTFALHSPSLLLMCSPHTHLMMRADMDGNTNDPRWTQILSCFKAGGFRQYPFLALTCWRRRGWRFSLHRGFMGFMTPVPSSYLSLHWHVSHRLELAGEENKQITRKQTQQLISMKWNEENAFSSMQTEWVRGKGRE